MSDWLIDMISEKSFDDPVEAKMDSLDNVFKIKQTAELIGVSPDSVLNMSDSTLVAAADSALQKIQSAAGDTIPLLDYQKFGLEGTDIDYDIRTKKGFLPFGPERGFLRRYSDVGKGTEVMNLLGIPGVPTIGLGKQSILYDPTPEFGEEKYYREYTDELIRRAEVLDDPESLMWRSKWVAGGHTGARFLGSPGEVLEEGYIEKGRVELYNNALLALNKMPSDSKAHKDLSSLLSEDQWKDYKYDENVIASLVPQEEPKKYNKGFLPIPEEIAELKGWGRNPFLEVSDSLNAISDFKAESLAADVPITMQDQPEWMFDPKFDQVPTE